MAVGVLQSQGQNPEADHQEGEERAYVGEVVGLVVVKKGGRYTMKEAFRPWVVDMLVDRAP